MKIIVTTSDNYHHALKVFCFLFKKQEQNLKDALRVEELNVDVVGYKKPDFELPNYFKFISLGEQRGAHYFSTDLRSYFEKQDQYFIWLMEDMFLRSVEVLNFRVCTTLLHPQVGRINLSGEAIQQLHKTYGYFMKRTIYENLPIALYRLSTQPSIWNKDFLLKYLTPGLTPWKFETQETNDKYLILGLDEDHSSIKYNEGVRKYDINHLNLSNINPLWIKEMKQLKIIDDDTDNQ